MSRDNPNPASDDSRDRPDGGFATTSWTVVLEAARLETPRAALALETLCAAYWRPLYVWLRCQHPSRYRHHDAQDLVQAFFDFLLQRNALSTVHPAKGRFRSFLLASLKHFVANQKDRSSALKRGGGVAILPLCDVTAAASLEMEASTALAPDQAYEQSWALTLFSAALDRLKAEYVADGKEALHDAIQPYLTEDKARVPHAETARALGLGEGAVRMAVLRMRRRFGELLRAEIAPTVGTPEEIDDELRALLRAVGG